jgi:hypothetical protein
MKNLISMKKLIILVISLIVCYSGFSQTKATFLKESFDTPGFPTGWTRTGVGVSNWSVAGSNNAGGDPYELQLTWSPQFNGKARFVSPVINTTGASSLVIEFIHCLDNYSGSHTIGIETTSNGGTTWNIGWQQNYSSDGIRKIVESISTTDVGSANFQFCLFYQGNSYNINDWFFDNFELYSLENLDAAITSINNPIYIASGNHKADFTVVNRGTTIINSLEVEYQFGDLPPVTETFTSLNMASLVSKTLSFTTETLLLPDTYTLKVNILKANGVVDDSPGNNYLEKIISAGITQGQRKVCIEHFTSSTCGPCVNPNLQMKALLENPDNEGKFSITKYQMNWPGAGDIYYTPEGGVRRNYYGVNAVPHIMWNAKYSMNINQTTFNNMLAEPAFMDIAGSFDVSGTNITVNFDVASYLSIPSARVYAIVNQKRTTGNIGPNGEKQFFHVMMKMLPNADGTTTSFNTGDIKSFTFTQDMSGTHVEKMDSLEVHIFVQSHSTKYIYNSNFLTEYTSILLNPPTNLSLQDIGNNNIAVTWDQPTTGTPSGYNIYLNDELIQANHTSTSYTATITQFGIQAFKVKAVYAVGISVPVADYIVITCPSTPPTNLNAEPIGEDVVLTWTAPNGDVDYYNVYFNGVLYANNITATTHTITNVPVGVHIFGVTAFTDGCESGMATVSLEIDCNTELPESLEAVQEGADVILTWEPPTADVVVDSYNIYLDGMLYEENIIETTYTFVDAPEGTHLYGITAVIGECESDIVEKEFITIGITEYENIAKVYPNPANHHIYVEGNNLANISIYNNAGQLVDHIMVDHSITKINTENFNQGIYLLQIKTKSGLVKIEKIVITK